MIFPTGLFSSRPAGFSDEYYRALRERAWAARRLAQEEVDDAMRGPNFDNLCHVIEAHIEARPDIDHTRLMELGNKLCRMADAAERKERSC